MSEIVKEKMTHVNQYKQEMEEYQFQLRELSKVHKDTMEKLAAYEKLGPIKAIGESDIKKLAKPKDDEKTKALEALIVGQKNKISELEGELGEKQIKIESLQKSNVAPLLLPKLVTILEEQKEEKKKKAEEKKESLKEIKEMKVIKEKEKETVEADNAEKKREDERRRQELEKRDQEREQLIQMLQKEVEKSKVQVKSIHTDTNDLLPPNKQKDKVQTDSSSKPKPITHRIYNLYSHSFY